MGSELMEVVVPSSRGEATGSGARDNQVGLGRLVTLGGLQQPKEERVGVGWQAIGLADVSMNMLNIWPA